MKREIDHSGCESLTSEKDIFDFMYNFTGQLRSDCDFNSNIEIEHRDESKFVLISAHLEEDEKKIYIYTEHCGFFWFYKDDLEKMRHYHFSYDKHSDKFKCLFDRVMVFDHG